MMTTEEADVMLELLKVGSSSDFSLSEWDRWNAAVTSAEQLLTQHADDQKTTDLAWLVENYEGHGGYAGHGSGDDLNWDFWTDGEAEVGVCCRNGAVAIHIWTHWIPGDTRGDVRVLERLGLLVPKKKGEVA